MLEALKRKKMKREKEMEVPILPKGKQDNEHVVMYYTIKRRREENSRQNLREGERYRNPEIALLGGRRHIN